MKEQAQGKEIFNMTVLEPPDIPVEEYHLPEYAYLLEHDHGTEERNRAIRNHIVYGIPFDPEILVSDRAKKMRQILLEEHEARRRKAATA